MNTPLLNGIEKKALLYGPGGLILPAITGAAQGASGEPIKESLGKGAIIGGLLKALTIGGDTATHASPKQKILAALASLSTGALTGAGIAGWGHWMGSDYKKKPEGNE